MPTETPAEAVPQVLTEIQAGDGLGFAAAGRLFPGHRGGGTVNPSTVWRWARTGAKAADGQVIRLEVCRVGSRWLTSRGAVARFVAALTTAAGPHPVPTPPRSSSARLRASRAANKKLEDRGA